MSTARRYELISAAYGLGATRPEAAMAPSVLRQSGLVERLRLVSSDILDQGDIVAPDIEITKVNPKLKYIETYLAFSELLAPRLRTCYMAGRKPIVLGGDHSVSISTISLAVEALKRRCGNTAEMGLLWVDTHGDINTPETTPSGNIHGMSVAALLGLGDQRLTNLYGFSPKLKPENIAFVGLRDLDPPEKTLLKKLGILTYTMREVDLLGIGEVAQKAIKHVTANTAGFVTSFDLDVCDPSIAPGVCTPIRGGLTYREAHLIMELSAENPANLSIELMELNPYLDHNHMTSDLALALLESAVGKTII